MKGVSGRHVIYCFTYYFRTKGLIVDELGPGRTKVSHPSNVL